MKKLFLFFATLCLSIGAMAYDATFENTTSSFGWYAPGAMVAIDLDGYGYQSVLFMEGPNDYRSCYLYNGSGSFFRNDYSSNVGISGLGIPYYKNSCMVAMHVDNDGKQDLVVAGYLTENAVDIPHVDVYLSNDAFHTMTPSAQTTLQGAVDYAYSDYLAAGDYDNDGYDDLFVLGPHASGNVLSIYHNNGGTFGAPNQSLPGGNGGSITVGDVNGDGNLDIFYSGYNGSAYQVHLYYGDGHGNWTHEGNITFEEAIFGGVAIIDFDNDGDGDLLQYGKQHGVASPQYYTTIFQNNGNGFTKKAYNVTGLPQYAEGMFLDYGDFNLDGKIDVIVSKSGLGSQGTALYLCNEDMTFTYQNLNIGAYDGGVFAWDYDKDGKCDYMAWNKSDGSTWAAPIVHNTTIPAIALSENANNSAILAKWNGQTANVTLTRNMVADGDFHTLCLPFSLNASQIASAFGGAGYELKELTDAEMEDETLNLIFAEASSIEAGKPYLFKPATTIDAPIAINGVTIYTTLAPQTKAALVTFTGVFNPTELTAGDKNTLILDAGNTLGWPSETANMPGMRAYFAIHGGASSAVAARAYFDGKISTSTENVPSAATNIQKVLDNGQVVIIYNGIRYNVMGQKIR